MQGIFGRLGATAFHEGLHHASIYESMNKWSRIQIQPSWTCSLACSSLPRMFKISSEILEICILNIILLDTFILIWKYKVYYGEVSETLQILFKGSDIS